MASAELLDVVERVGMGLSRSQLFGGDRGFLDQHDGDFVADRVDPTAGWGLAFEAGVVCGWLDRGLAGRADENVQEILGDWRRHGGSEFVGGSWHIECTGVGWVVSRG